MTKKETQEKLKELNERYDFVCNTGTDARVSKILDELHKVKEIVREERTSERIAVWNEILKMRDTLNNIENSSEYHDLDIWLERDYSAGVDFSGKLKTIWASEDKRFIIVHKGSGTCWVSMMEPSKYTPVEYWLIDRSKGDYKDSIGGQIKKLEGNRLTQKIMKEWQDLAASLQKINLIFCKDAL